MNVPVTVGSTVALLAFASVTAASWTASAALLPKAESRARVVGTIIVGFWLHAVLSYLLAFPGFFRFAPAVVVCLAVGIPAVAAIWRSGRLRELLVADVDACRTHVGTMFGAATATATLGISTVVGMQFAHANLTPPLGWDALTYHLPRAALWVQNGSLEDTFGAPNAWEYFSAFWPVGDTLFAWAMVFTWSDIGIPFIAGFTWLCGIVCSYVLARELGAERSHAWVAALAVWSLPALTRHAFVGHLENFMGALIVGGVAMLVVGSRDRDARALTLGLAALGVVAVTKPVALPYAAAAAVVYVILFATRFRDQKLAALLAPLPGLVGSIPSLVYQAAVYGSPMYPFQLELGGRVLFEANPEFAYVLAKETAKTPKDYLVRLFWEGPYGGYITHINFGIVAPVAMLLGVVGLVLLWRRGPGRLVMTVFLAFAAFAVYELLTNYTSTGNSIARHVAALPLLLGAAAATLRWDWVRHVLTVAMFGNLVFFLPFNWYGADRDLLWDAAPAIFGVVVAVGVSLWALHRGRTWRAAAAVALVATLAFPLLVWQLEDYRLSKRYVIYESAGRGKSYTNIRLGGGSGNSFRSAKVWEKADKPAAPKKLAVVAGWDGRGINWATYPLFGQRLQNELIYISPTEPPDISPRERRKHRAAADYETWLARLKAAKVDYVVTMHPASLESRWIITNPKDFEVVAREGKMHNMMAKLKAPPPRKR